LSGEPLVSVVTAAYNMGDYVAEAVDSVLAQNYPNVESIVVDDGSTDGTAQVLELYRDEPRVTVVRQANAGQTAAKNRGLAAARGELIGFCDADNRWLPDKLSVQVPLFVGRPRLGVVYGDLILIDGAGERLPTPPVERFSGDITAQLLVDNFVTFNTTLTPRRVLEEVGGFDESLRMAIDYDLWLRISLRYEFLHVPRPLVEYRIWGGQMSHRTGERMDNFFRLLEKFLRDHPDAVTAAQARRAWAHSLTTRGRWLASVGRRREACRDYVQAFRHRPYDRRLWKSAARLLLGLR
jgi:glycosyltransferase involved in cell wall biosynthesis